MHVLDESWNWKPLWKIRSGPLDGPAWLERCMEMLWTIFMPVLSWLFSITIHAITLIWDLYFDVSECNCCNKQYSLLSLVIILKLICVPLIGLHFLKNKCHSTPSADLLT